MHIINVSLCCGHRTLVSDRLKLETYYMYRFIELTCDMSISGQQKKVCSREFSVSKPRFKALKKDADFISWQEQIREDFRKKAESRFKFIHIVMKSLVV